MTYYSYDAVIATLRRAMMTTTPCAVFGILPAVSHKPVTYIYWSGSELIVNTFGDSRDEHPAMRHADIESVIARLAPLGPAFLHWIPVTPRQHEQTARSA